MKRATAATILGALVVLLVLMMSVYLVDPRKAAVKFQLGEVVAVETQPGLYFLVPGFQNVRLFDTRIQTLEARDPQTFLTSENRNVLVDSYVKWKVVDVRLYYVSVGGDAIGGVGAPGLAGARRHDLVRADPADRPRCAQQLLR